MPWPPPLGGRVLSQTHARGPALRGWLKERVNGEKKEKKKKTSGRKEFPRRSRGTYYGAVNSTTSFPEEIIIFPFSPRRAREGRLS